MPSLKDVIGKIAAVKKTKQITKAMNMVASAKLRNAQTRIERFRPYAGKFYDMLADLAKGADESVHPLLEVRDTVASVGIVLVTSDRGLCGSFNARMIQAGLGLAKEVAAKGGTPKFYCVGKKGRDAVRRAGYQIVSQWTDMMNSFDFQFANDIGLQVIDAYLSGELDQVMVVYGEFISMARQQPVVQQILPMAADAEEVETTSGVQNEYVYEPSVEGLLAELLPRFIKVQVYRGLLDTSASEHAARMTAMDNATRACDDMTNSLTLLYNKTRQTAITKELMDIVGGAEALKG